jgi:hypothetical protein
METVHIPASKKYRDYRGFVQFVGGAHGKPIVAGSGEKASQTW